MMHKEVQVESPDENSEIAKLIKQHDEKIKKIETAVNDLVKLIKQPKDYAAAFSDYNDFPHYSVSNYNELLQLSTYDLFTLFKKSTKKTLELDKFLAFQTEVKSKFQIIRILVDEYARNILADKEFDLLKKYDVIVGQFLKVIHPTTFLLLRPEQQAGIFNLFVSRCRDIPSFVTDKAEQKMQEILCPTVAPKCVIL